MNDLRSYKVLYMLPSSMDESAVTEFEAKLNTEITNMGGATKASHRQRSYMVKTSQNKGSRGVNFITLTVELKPNSIVDLKKFFALAQGVIVNYLILKVEEEHFRNAA